MAVVGLSRIPNRHDKWDQSVETPLAKVLSFIKIQAQLAEIEAFLSLKIGQSRSMSIEDTLHGVNKENVFLTYVDWKMYNENTLLCVLSF